jgi:hypothetical protein
MTEEERQQEQIGCIPFFLVGFLVLFAALVAFGMITWGVLEVIMWWDGLSP